MTRENKNGLGKIDFRVTTPIMALMAIVFGVLVIVFKDLLPWLVGIYFINTRNTVLHRILRT